MNSIMGGLKLYTYPNNKNANKALIAAKYVDVHIETPAFNMSKDSKTPHFLALNPLGKVRTVPSTLHSDSSH